MGGGYLDTDVEIKKDIEPLIDAGMVCGIQNHRVGTNELDFVSLEGIDSRNGKRATFFCVQSGFLYSEPNHQFVKHCMQVMYDNGNKPFISESGKTNQFVIDWRLMAELSKFGVLYRDKEQWCVKLICTYMIAVCLQRESQKTKARILFTGLTNHGSQIPLFV